MLEMGISCVHRICARMHRSSLVNTWSECSDISLLLYHCQLRTSFDWGCVGAHSGCLPCCARISRAKVGTSRATSWSDYRRREGRLLDDDMEHRTNVFV